MTDPQPGRGRLAAALVRHALGALAFVAIVLVSLVGATALAIFTAERTERWADRQPRVVQTGAGIAPVVFVIVGVSGGCALAKEAWTRIARPETLRRTGRTAPPG